MPTKAKRLANNKRYKAGHPGQLKSMRSPARQRHQDKRIDRQEARAQASFPKPVMLPRGILDAIWSGAGFRIGWNPSRRRKFMQDAVYDNPQVKSASVTVIKSKDHTQKRTGN